MHTAVDFKIVPTRFRDAYRIVPAQLGFKIVPPKDDLARVDFESIKRNTGYVEKAAVRTLANQVARAVWNILGNAQRMTELLDQDVADIATVAFYEADLNKLKSICKQTCDAGWLVGIQQARRESRKIVAQMSAVYDESQHPRDVRGMWTDANGNPDISHGSWKPGTVAKVKLETNGDFARPVIEVIKDPTQRELNRFLGEGRVYVRYSIDYEAGHYVVWDASEAIHSPAENALGVQSFGAGISSNSDDDVTAKGFITHITEKVHGAYGIGHITQEQHDRLIKQLSRESFALQFAADWDETLHPRESDGKFAPKGSADATGQGKDKFDPVAWRAKGMSESRKEWAQLSREEKDAAADPTHSVEARVDELLNDAKQPFPDTGEAQADIEQYVNTLTAYTSSSSRAMLKEYGVNTLERLKAAGAKDADAREMALEVARLLAAQDLEAAGRTLGDHGIHHIEQDLNLALQTLEVMPGYTPDPKMVAAMTVAVAFHDSGYLTPPARVFLDDQHQRWSAEYFTSGTRDQLASMLGEKYADFATTAIAVHDGTTVDWKNEPEFSAITLADNLALFHAEKMPPMIRYVPANMKAMIALGQGRISLDATKAMLRNNIETAHLSDPIRKRMLEAVDEVSPFLPKFTVGMVGAKMDRVTWSGDHPSYHITRYASNEALARVLDLGQKQFRKLAETYGQDPDKFVSSGKMSLQSGDQTLFEATIERGGNMTRLTFADLRDNAADYFEANGFRMAQNLSDGARAIIQQELTKAVRTGETGKSVAANIYDRLLARGFTDVQAVESEIDNEEVLAEILDVDYADQVPSYLNTLVRTNVFEAMNEARFAEFTDPALDGFVVALEYSAILDDVTTEFCRYMDGRVYAADNEVWDTHRPPNHYNCRSILIPITQMSNWDGQESPPPEMEPAVGFVVCAHGHVHGDGRSLADHRTVTSTPGEASDRPRFDFEYEEAKHPRDEKGRWTDGVDSGPITTGKELNAATPALAEIAQKVYDQWDENPDEYAGGGICHLIAEEMAGHLNDKGVDAQTVSATDEVHVYVVAKLPDGVYRVDIPPGVYERGGGYSWTKIPDVQITGNDVIVDRIDRNPDNYEQYLDFAKFAYDEAQHPRDEHGRWVEASNGSTAREFDGTHVKGGGLWKSNTPTHSKLPPKGKILAAYTDQEGYTVRVVGGIPAGESAVAMGVRRYGVFRITAPDGKSVRAGYWMNFPETEWNIPSTRWSAMSWEDRAAREAYQQATAYKPLREQFQFDSDTPLKKRAEFAYDEAQHPRAPDGKWTDAGGGAITAYHGTVKSALEGIKREGLRIGKRRTFGDGELYQGPRHGAVFVANRWQTAAWYAKQHSRGTPVVLELRVPKSAWAKFQKDTEHQGVGAAYTTGKIPAKWIVRASRYDHWDGLIPIDFSQPEELTLYLVLSVDDSTDFSFDPNEPRDEHGRWTDGTYVGNTPISGEYAVSVPSMGPMVWAEQVGQHPERGPPGIAHTRNYIGKGKSKPVDTLLWRDDKGILRGLLYYYPKDLPPYEKAGNFNVFVDPLHQRQGIGTELVREAGKRWNIDLWKQDYTPEGAALAKAVTHPDLMRPPRYDSSGMLIIPRIGAPVRGHLKGKGPKRKHARDEFHLPGQHDQADHGNWGGEQPAGPVADKQWAVASIDESFNDPSIVDVMKDEIAGWPLDSRSIARGAISDLEDDEGRVFEATAADGRLIGVMSTGESEHLSPAQYIGVHYLAAAEPGHGIGTKLLEKAFEAAADAGLGVSLYSVENAVDFYRAMGGEEVVNQYHVFHWPPEKVAAMMTKGHTEH